MNKTLHLKHPFIIRGFVDLIPASIMMLKFTAQILHHGVKAGVGCL